MTTIKELKHFNIGESYGGNQDWFRSYMMRLGGCGAETACDLSIYLKKYKGIEKACELFIDNITRQDYVDFAHEMKKYLWPRLTGIDKASIWIEGYANYLENKGVNFIKMREFSGEEAYKDASHVLMNRIDRGFPIPNLTLRHRAKEFDDYNWHWFLINGYKIEDDKNGNEKIFVKAVTYSEYEWLDFEKLWNTGNEKRGGLVLVDIRET